MITGIANAVNPDNRRPKNMKGNESHARWEDNRANIVLTTIQSNNTVMQLKKNALMHRYRHDIIPKTCYCLTYQLPRKWVNLSAARSENVVSFWIKAFKFSDISSCSASLRTTSVSICCRKKKLSRRHTGASYLPVAKAHVLALLPIKFLHMPERK
jgi:hypothetical protein